MLVDRRDRHYGENDYTVLESPRADFDIGKRGRLDRSRPGVSVVPKTHEAHWTEAQWLYSMEVSRDIDRNDMVVGGALDKLCNNILPAEYVLEVTTDDDQVNKDIEQRWKERKDSLAWNESNAWKWRRLVKYGLRQMLVDGDCLAIPQTNGKLNMIEAHRCRTPGSKSLLSQVVKGIRFNDNEVPQEYWITKENISPLRSISRLNDFEVVPAFSEFGFPQVYHVFSPKRFSQRRGVTALAATAKASGLHDDIQLAKLVQSQVTSLFAIIRERAPTWREMEEGPYWDGEPVGENKETKTTENADGTAGKGIPVEAPGFGIEVKAQPGETIKGFSPNIPNPEFFEHSMMILRFVAASLGVPLAVMLLDMSEHNFNSWRGAMDQARGGFISIQHDLRDTFHDPVINWDVELAKGEDGPIGNFFRKKSNKLTYTWHLPRWPYINPKEDSQTALLRKLSLLAPPSELQSEQGRDYKTDIIRTIDDNSFAIIVAHEKAQEVNKATGLDLAWTDMLRLSVLPNISGAAQKALMGDDSKQPQQEDDQTDKQQEQESIARAYTKELIGRAA